MSEELKSAFEIEGFLEELTIITKENGLTLHKIVDGVLHWKESRAKTWEISHMVFNTLNRKIWRSFIEPKPKTYRHYYRAFLCDNLAGERFYNLRMVETQNDWNTFIDINGCGDIYKLETTEVVE